LVQKTKKKCFVKEEIRATDTDDPTITKTGGSYNSIHVPETVNSSLVIH
jgi:hypothetical protein